MFAAQHTHYWVTVDVGWYPSMSPEGNYRALLLDEDDWNNPLDSLTTRSLAELVPWIEQRLANTKAFDRFPRKGKERRR